MKTCPACQIEYSDEQEYCPTDGMKLRSKTIQSADPLIGTTLDGRWVIESKIGEGGMGAVYRAHQPSVDRPVALKTLRPQHDQTDEYINRFFREAQVAARISHPNCVTIHDFGQDAETGTLYLVMEYLEGEPLTDAIARRQMTFGEVADVAIQISSALAAAHEHQIVHRDLKPDNVFMLDVAGGGSFVKVLDFGIAKLLEADTQMTRTGTVLGTPNYMSPEQCDGINVDLRSDLYSLGCILYEMLGGRTPFGGGTPMAVLLAHVSKAPQPLSALGLTIPGNLEAIVMRLLEKLPDARFATASDVRDALQESSALMGAAARARTVESIGVTRDDWVFAETAHSESPRIAAAHPGETAPIQPSSSRTPLLLGLASAALLVVIAGLVVGAMFRQPEPEPVEPETSAIIEKSPEPVAAIALEADAGTDASVAVAEVVEEPEKEESVKPSKKATPATKTVAKRKRTVRKAPEDKDTTPMATIDSVPESKPKKTSRDPVEELKKKKEAVRKEIRKARKDAKKLEKVMDVLN